LRGSTWFVVEIPRVMRVMRAVMSFDIWDSILVWIFLGMVGLKTSSIACEIR
jgi:hypothetical protein